MMWTAVIVSRFRAMRISDRRCRQYFRNHRTGKTKVKKRKIGDVCRFVYDRAMPQDFLDYLIDAFHIDRRELVPGDKHLNLEDLRHLPNPNPNIHPIRKPQPMKLTYLNERESIFQYVEKKDLLLHYPYHSFEHFIHFLYEAVHEPTVREIMVTNTGWRKTPLLSIP